MIIQERKFEKCKECGSRGKMLQDELYGCDNCKKQIGDLTSSIKRYLEIVVFFKNRESKHFRFCSWDCVFKKLKKLKTDYFITLPFLNFDNKEKGQHPKDFWKAIKQN